MASAAVNATQQQQRQEAIQDTAAIAILVREALVKSLPVSPEQYLTLSVPGLVVDTEDIANGGTFVYNTQTTPFTPTAVRQAEGKLVDSMQPLGSIMVR
jgi:hypothetical protein